MNAITISSQRYINDKIVSEKIAAKDFTVLVSPEFEVGGIVVRVVLDGHHSYAAAIEAGVSPEFVEATGSDHDAVGMEQDNPEGFLEVTHLGDDYYNIETGGDVW